MTPYAARRSERGVTLVFVALLSFGVLGLAAVVIDLGLARAAQASMQNAADVAALEGLRLRDDVLGDPIASDLARRQLASRAATRVFDDDADLSTGNSDILLGAGPSLELVGGVGELDASAQIVIGAPYIPVLAPNDGNAVHGDLVAGEYLGGLASEEASYLRTDFAVAAVDVAPTSLAFLARLRRTHDPLGLDAEGGVSTSAPALPYSFGRGSGMLAEDASYDPRADGITVRATAIADARPALRCGSAVAGAPGMLVIGSAGATSVVLSLDVATWNDPACLSDTFTIQLSSAGVATALAPGAACDGAAVGRSAALVDARTVGRLMPSAGIAFGLGVVDVPIGYVAIARPTASAAVQTIGFVAVEVVSAVASGPPGTIDLTLRRTGAFVAPTNASAHDRSAHTALASDASLRAAIDSIASPLLAPALVR